LNSFICSSDLEDPPPKAAIPPVSRAKEKLAFSFSEAFGLKIAKQ
jgi:hypothetical protein